MTFGAFTNYIIVWSYRTEAIQCPLRRSHGQNLRMHATGRVLHTQLATICIILPADQTVPLMQDLHRLYTHHQVLCALKPHLYIYTIQFVFVCS